MKIRQVVVVQTRLYPADMISLSTLIILSERLQMQFRFQAYGPAPSAQGPVQAFMGGIYSDGTSIWPVGGLQIGGRHIEFQIEARSDVADRFFEALAGALSEMLPGRPDFAQPIHKTETTTSVIELDFDMGAVVNPQLTEVLERVGVQSFAQPNHRVTLRPVQLGISVSWAPTTDETAAVRLTDKRLQLEVRQGTRPEERVFFVSCPSDSETHDRLLASLEKAFLAHSR